MSKLLATLIAATFATAGAFAADVERDEQAAAPAAAASKADHKAADHKTPAAPAAAASAKK